jgi:hypothetical protein
MYKDAKVVRGDTDVRWLIIVQQEGWGGEFLFATCRSADDADLVARLLNRRYQQRSKKEKVNA